MLAAVTLSRLALFSVLGMLAAAAVVYGVTDPSREPAHPSRVAPEQTKARDTDAPQRGAQHPIGSPITVMVHPGTVTEQPLPFEAGHCYTIIAASGRGEKFTLGLKQNGDRAAPFVPLPANAESVPSAEIGSTVAATGARLGGPCLPAVTNGSASVVLTSVRDTLITYQVLVE
jgi:hypothetical protein